MKRSLNYFPAFFLLFPLSLMAAEPGEESSERHRKIENITVEQDELQADVQELVAEQTDKEVIRMLEECQEFMNEAIDGLERYDTGGKTIAAQTDVIKKIHEAAKQRASSCGNGSMDSMLQMMEGMMGQEKKDSSGNEQEGNENDSPGKGGNGEGEAKKQPVTGNNTTERKHPRRLPKSGGKEDISYPREFSKAMDAYNKSLESSAPALQPAINN